LAISRSIVFRDAKHGTLFTSIRGRRDDVMEEEKMEFFPKT